MCCSLLVVLCVLFEVRGLLCVVCSCLLVVGCWWSGAVHGWLWVVGGSLFVVCCLLFACGLLVVVVHCCLLFYSLLLFFACGLFALFVLVFVGCCLSLVWCSAGCVVCRPLFVVCGS